MDVSALSLVKDAYTVNVQCVSQTGKVLVIPKREILEFKKKI